MRGLPISEYPEVAPPSVVVRAQYPGANPKVIAETVATPLEESINGVEGMLYMGSQATTDGVMTLTVTFKLGTDPDKAQQLVQNRVSQAEPRLPEEVRRLGVTTVKSAPDLTMVVHLVSPNNRYDIDYLRNYAVLNVKDRLARIGGVGQVQIFGGGDYSMRVWLDPQKVAQRGLSASDVVSAIRGMALGGGCELAVHSARRVVHMESYIGLVEVGVGLVPGAGGLTYIARRAAENAETSTGKDLMPFLTEGFTAAAMAKVGTSALESRKLGYLLDSDVIVPHKDELLFVAINEAKSMAASGWRAPHKRLFPVAGRSGLATIKAQLVNMRDGGFISAYDFKIGAMIAEVVCGGDVDAGSMVSEEYLLTLERKVFCHLIAQPKTHERILGMLSTGKPVRN